MDEHCAHFLGAWDVLHATLPNGENAYTGVIRVEPRQDTFELTWEISAGRYVGLGLAASGHVFVSCGEQYAGLGIALLHHQPNRQITAQWSTPELQGAIGTGRFLSEFSGSFVGTHRLQFSLPDGRLHGEWELHIQEVGDLFEVTWQKGESVHFTGLGLATATGLALGWYPDLRQLAFLDYLLDPSNPNQLSATWALGGFNTLGTETLKRLG